MGRRAGGGLPEGAARLLLVEMVMLVAVEEDEEAAVAEVELELVALAVGNPKMERLANGVPPEPAAADEEFAVVAEATEPKLGKASEEGGGDDDGAVEFSEDN